MSFQRSLFSVCEEEISYNQILSPMFWRNYRFDDRIRRKLIEIAETFTKSIEIDIEIIDIILTGSLANYNYSKYSDLDVHIVCNFKKINNDTDLVRKALDGQRFIWNLKHNITIKGHEVELYFQDISEFHQSSGTYSLKQDKWIVKPDVTKVDVSSSEVDQKVERYSTDIAKLIKYVKKCNNSDQYRSLFKRAEHLKKKISNLRKEGLREGGEYSIGNLVFKELRNTGAIKGLVDLLTKSYDGIYTEVVLPMNIGSEKISSVNMGKKGPRQQKVTTGMSRQSQNMMPVMHKVDPSLNTKVETLRKKERGRIILSPADVYNIRDMYNLKNLDKKRSRNLGRSGIMIRYDNNLNCFVIEK